MAKLERGDANPNSPRYQLWQTRASSPPFPPRGFEADTAWGDAPPPPIKGDQSKARDLRSLNVYVPQLSPHDVIPPEEIEEICSTYPALNKYSLYIESDNKNYHSNTMYIVTGDTWRWVTAADVLHTKERMAADILGANALASAFADLSYIGPTT